MKAADQLPLPLIIQERSGFDRVAEPVTVGLPFPRGRVLRSDVLALYDSDGRACTVQFTDIARWSDGSVKWALLDFLANVNAGTAAAYHVDFRSKDGSTGNSSSVYVKETNDQIVVDTGKATFFVQSDICKPFDHVLIGQTELLGTGGSSLLLTDEAGKVYHPHLDETLVESRGPVRTTLRLRGQMRAPEGVSLAKFEVRLSFFVDSGFVQAQITLHNPRPAQHPGGLWDLGDEGSIYFKDLSLTLPTRIDGAPRVSWRIEPERSQQQLSSVNLQIYQDSSGGENWRSSNHVNRVGRIAQAFRGYRVSVNESPVEEGLRASPVVDVRGASCGVAGTFDKFWQNFPKAIEVNDDVLVLRLFPRQFDDLHELQGGEQKTHTVYLHFSLDKDPAWDLRWVHDRLMPQVRPEWYTETKACDYLSPSSEDPNVDCKQIVDSAIVGSNSFAARREVIDEYGWRHFGDLYADHEAIDHTGAAPLVAHYNNQYDVVHGALVQYLRGSDPRWFECARNLAQHVIDIDIYHTDHDRAFYNGGLFWHTDHYLDAGLGTHRTYSKASLKVRGHSSYGGGPSNEHNYTSGLLLYYFLTGDETSRAAVLSLADWVINMDDGSRRTLGFIDQRPTGMASSTASRDYHGPGRGAGNSINVLLDGHTLTQEPRYLNKAEELIRRCIHPKDNIASRNLDDLEHRWSYLVFLQALGKYLDHKTQYGSYDFMYSYAQASLLHYAGWMLDHEVPYSTLLHKVEIPTETWPAQDIRKCVVFHLATKHATGSDRAAFKEKANYFFYTCITDLSTFPSRTLTRPLVLLMTNAYVHAYFQRHPEESAVPSSKVFNYDRPRCFKPQFAELYRARDFIAAAWRLLQTAVHRISESGRKLQVAFGARDG